MASHPSTLAWKIPWSEEPGSYGPWGCKESDTTELLHLMSFIESQDKNWNTYKHFSLKQWSTAVIGSSIINYFILLSISSNFSEKL